MESGESVEYVGPEDDGGGQDIFITHQIAAAKYDRRTLIKVSIRECLIYAVFFVVLCIAAFGTVNTPMYYYTYVVRKLFTEAKFTSEDGQVITMKEINTMEQLWSYLTKIVARSCDWKFWYSSYDKIAEASEEDRNVLFDNRIIGSPRIRQVRVTNSSCKVPEEFKPIFSACYSYYSSGNEEKGMIQGISEGGGSGGDTAWTYSSASTLGSYSYTGSVATYGGGGYYKDLSKNAKDDEGMLSLLKSDLWINRATRALFVDISTYNGNINVFCFIKLVFELPPTGGVLASSNFNTLKLIRYHGAMGKLVLACEIIVAFFTLLFLLEEIIEIFSLRTAYFNSWWTVLDLVILAFLVSFLITAVVRQIVMHRNLEDHVKSHDYSSFDRLILLQNIFHYITAFLVFFAALRFLRYLKVNLVMNRLLNIVYESSPALFGFALIFFIILFAFALLGHLLFGTEVHWFSTVFGSFFSLHLMLLGEVNYQELVDANRIIGPLFFCTYIFFIFFILLNMFLAILNERFWAKNKQIDLDTEDSLGSVLKAGFQSFLNFCGCKRLVNKWKQRDEDRKGITRLKKLRQSLARSGFSDAEITAFLDRYEIDEDSLAAENADELIAKLRSDLQGIGSFDTTIQERIMNRIDTIENTLLSIHKKVDLINLRLRL